MSEYYAYCLPCKLNNEATPKTSTLYRFPSCPTRRKLWLEKLGLDDDTSIKYSTRVCEHHFQKDQKVRTRLKKDAVPAGPYKLTYYKGPALEALRAARELEVRKQRQQRQPQPQQLKLLPKLEVPKTLDFVIEGQPVIQAKWNNGQGQEGEDKSSGEGEGSTSSRSILKPTPVVPAPTGPSPGHASTSSKKWTTYAIPAVIYIEVDEHGKTQKTTVVPQGQAVIQPEVKASSSGSGGAS